MINLYHFVLHGGQVLFGFLPTMDFSICSLLYKGNQTQNKNKNKNRNSSVIFQSDVYLQSIKCCKCESKPFSFTTLVDRPLHPCVNLYTGKNTFAKMLLSRPPEFFFCVFTSLTA
jgi:hypothetical protein